jgi:hypothetical protein
MTNTALVFLALLLPPIAGAQTTPYPCSGLPTFTEWREGKIFPYRMQAERQKILRDGYSQLHIGMVASEVEAAIGKPDWAGPAPSNVCVWEYDLVRPGVSGYEKGTFRILFVEIGADRKLLRTLPKNIQGLHSIGNWSSRKTP